MATVGVAEAVAVAEVVVIPAASMAATAAVAAETRLVGVLVGWAATAGRVQSRSQESTPRSDGD